MEESASTLSEQPTISDETSDILDIDIQEIASTEPTTDEQPKHITSEQIPTSAETLRQLFESAIPNGPIQQFFTWAANRQNDTLISSVRYIAKTINADRRCVIELVEKLDELGCVRLMQRSSRAKAKIVWGKSLKSIGRVAIGEASEVEELDPELLNDNNSELFDELDELQHGTRSHIHENRPFTPIEQKVTIAQIKTDLARSLGVPVEGISITIRA